MGIHPRLEFSAKRATQARTRAFTLVELLITVAIVGVLATAVALRLMAGPVDLEAFQREGLSDCGQFGPHGPFEVNRTGRGLLKLDADPVGLLGIGAVIAVFATFQTQKFGTGRQSDMQFLKGSLLSQRLNPLRGFQSGGGAIDQRRHGGCRG